MKKVILKKAGPLMVFALGVVGAFGTMSMQSDKELAAETGWAKNALGQVCSLEVSCSDINGDMCRVSYPSGEIAYHKSGSVCTTALFRP